MIKNATSNPLINLKTDIEAHWREYLPNIVAEFEAEGVLAERIQEAFDLTEAAVLEAIAYGLDFWQAWGMWREEWAFLPPEDKVDPYAGAGGTWMTDWEPDALIEDDPDYEDTEGGA